MHVEILSSRVYARDDNDDDSFCTSYAAGTNMTGLDSTSSSRRIEIKS